MPRGRKPKPTAVKKASGALRKNPKRANKREPSPPTGWPDCPLYVKKDKPAHEHWKWLCKTLDEMHVLSKADLAVLEMAAVTYARWRELDVIIAGANVSEISGRGSVITRPEAVQVHKHADRYLKLISELGLTPSSRSRIKVDKQEHAQSGFEQLLSRMGAGKN